MDYKTIDFPQEGDRQRLYLGRNGTANCIGINLQAVAPLMGAPYLQVTAINSRQQKGRCWIEIPRDPAVIDQICDALQAMKQGL